MSKTMFLLHVVHDLKGYIGNKSMDSTGLK